MSRRKFKDYRNDPTVKTPILAWLSDRSVFYIAMTVFSVAVLVIVYSKGYEALQRINTEPVEVSPYMNVEPVYSQGQVWAVSLINEKPEGVKSWSVSKTSKPLLITTPSELNISSEKISTSVLSSYSAVGDGVESRVHVYGAGQAGKDFERYTKILEQKTHLEKASDKNGSSVMYEKGFYLTMGDAIVSVSASSNETRDQLFQFYSSRMPTTLKESGCYDLTTTANDASRSFFYDRDSYTGLEEKTTVETLEPLNNLPSPTGTEIRDINIPDAVEPESPLPADFPTLPEETVEKPSLPERVPTVDKFAENAVYNVADKNGPGCGWKWSGQEAPVYDLVELESTKNKTINDVQNSVDKKANDYTSSQKDWALQVALVMPKVNEWNSYAKSVNTVHERWRWLDAERAKLKEPWERYVADYDDWLTFDSRKADATEKYNEELQICVDKQDELLKWEEKWGDLWAEQEAEKNNPTPPASTTPTEAPETDEPTDPASPTESPSEGPTATPTPTPTQEPVDIPERPEGCSIAPQRPAIMDQTKPDEPQAPTIPEGVTIPDSWEKP